MTDIHQSKASINLHIERVVLDGVSVDRIDTKVIHDVLTSRLRDLLTSQGYADIADSTPSSVTRTESSIFLKDSSQPIKFGDQLAAAVHRSCLSVMRTVSVDRRGQSQ